MLDRLSTNIKCYHVQKEDVELCSVFIESTGYWKGLVRFGYIELYYLT